MKENKFIKKRFIYLRGPVQGPSFVFSHCPHFGLKTRYFSAHGLHHGPSSEQCKKNQSFDGYISLIPPSKFLQAPVEILPENY